MFSTPRAPSKPASSGGFFSSSPGSFFGSAPAQPEQKSSFFGLPSSLPTESLTSDLFGIFKGPEATQSGESQQLETQIRQDDHKNKLKTDIENASSTEEKYAEITQESEVPEKGLIENAERADKAEPEECDVTEPVEEEARNDSIELSEESKAGPQLAPEPKADAPSDLESKGIFDITGLTAPKFGFISGAAEGASSLGSLFSTGPSSVFVAKTPQPPQSDGGLFSGFKNLSAGIFQEEKPAGKEDPSPSSSVFGMKLGSMFGASDSPKAQATPPVVTSQPPILSPKLAEEVCQLEAEKLSLGSEETGSADVSDTEGPTETSKTGSCDTLHRSAMSGFPSLSLEEGLIPSPLEEGVVSLVNEENSDHNTDELKKESLQRLV
ncbi:hypothetical protein N1851_019989 [Merluccius polli]|uniref:Uncharacterized protein n=1 Tax=Merluccius polli TaxID=89951 RepID=A0AA47NZB3_MERPO|nr:hypothetical protein N1851_019989 [Merluccius polli]